MRRFGGLLLSAVSHAVGLTLMVALPLLTDAGLTDAERADLIAFLKGLDCPGTLEPPAAQ